MHVRKRVTLLAYYVCNVVLHRCCKTMTTRFEHLSDEELRQRLVQLGEEVGPITHTTRACYERMLKKKLRRPDEGDESSSKRQKRDHSPVAIAFSASPRKTNRSQPCRPSIHAKSSRPLPKLHVPSSVTPSPIQPIEQTEDETNDTRPSPRIEVQRPMPKLVATPPSLTDKLMQEGGQLLGLAAKWVGNGVKQFANKISSAISPPSTPRTTRRWNHSHSYGAEQYSIPLELVEIDHEVKLEQDTIPPPELNDWGLIPRSDPNPIPSAPPPPSYTPQDLHYEWELLPGDVEICLRPDGTKWLLGKGGFGEVYKGIKDKIDEVAVKEIRLSNTTINNQFKTEIDMISKLRHKNILQFYGACLRPPTFFMVTELMQQDLFSALRKEKDALLYKWSGRYGRDVLCGIGAGIHYLHSRKPPVVHRDIKSPNILLHENIAKIADVGIARTKLDSDMTAQRGFTIAWAAPEVIYRRRATEKIDIWGYGIILWEVVTGSLPGAGRLELPSTVGISLKRIYDRCTAEDPALRPTAAEVVQTLRSATL